MDRPSGSPRPSIWTNTEGVTVGIEGIHISHGRPVISPHLPDHGFLDTLWLRSSSKIFYNRKRRHSHPGDSVGASGSPHQDNSPGGTETAA